jgi:hypothetical protein
VCALALFQCSLFVCVCLYVYTYVCHTCIQMYDTPCALPAALSLCVSVCMYIRMCHTYIHMYDIHTYRCMTHLPLFLMFYRESLCIYVCIYVCVSYIHTRVPKKQIPTLMRVRVYVCVCVLLSYMGANGWIPHAITTNYAYHYY